MSIDQHPSIPAYAPAPEQPKKTKKQRLRTVAISAAAGLLVGILAGAGSTPEPEVVTHTEFKTITETVEVQAPLPQSCIRAFQQGEAVMDKYGAVGKLASRGIGAAYDRDSSLLETLTEETKTLSQQISTQAGVYGTAKAACAKDTDTDIPFLSNGS